MDVITLKPGDPCPNCGGKLEECRALSAADYARIYDRDNPQPVPARTDTMHPDQRAEHGALWQCIRCAYATRFK